MPDITTIAAVLNSLKAATDIAKFLRESDLSLERAELKLKLADLVGTLADTARLILTLQETLSEKDKRISEARCFSKQRRTRASLRPYYSADESGKPIGVAYCLRCWENDHKKRQLVQDAKDRFSRVCTTCGHRYDGRLAAEILSPKEEQAT